MTHITVFADIAGRPSKKVANPLTTAAAVAFRTEELADLRVALDPSMPKWKDLNSETARTAIGFLKQNALAVAAVTVNRSTHQWAKAIADSELLHSKIASYSRAKAGWAKLPVLLTYELLVRACLLALAQTLRVNREAHVFSTMGATAVECNIVCDQEFSGKEDVDVFKSFWNGGSIPSNKLWQLGYSISHPQVCITTDEEERLLVLADIAAGLCHSARLPDPGRIPMPLPCASSRRLLEPLHDNGKLALDSYSYETTYDAIFGEAMRFARNGA